MRPQEVCGYNIGVIRVYGKMIMVIHFLSTLYFLKKYKKPKKKNKKIIFPINSKLIIKWKNRLNPQIRDSKINK